MTTTLSMTDGTTMTFPVSSASIARTDAGQTFTGNQTIAGNVTFGANITAPLATISVGLIGASFIQTDNTTGPGTLASVYGSSFGAVTFATSNNSVTVTNGYGAYFATPAAGSNVTLTNSWALGADSAQFNGNLSVTGNATFEGTIRLDGSTSGTVTIDTQAAAGTYNFNLPTSAGSTGAPLLSGGGSSSPMTWGTVTGTGNFVLSASPTFSGTVTMPDSSAWSSSGASEVNLRGSNSGTITIETQAAAGTYNFNLPISAGANGAILVSGGGGSTAMSWLADIATGSVLVSGGVNAAPSYSSSPAVNSLQLNGSGSGVVTIQPGAAAAGTFNWNLPTSAGSSGQPLLSAGGGSSPMTWGSLTGTGDFVLSASPTFSGTVTMPDASTWTSSGVTLSDALNLNGSTSGTISIETQAAAGTYNFNLPTSSGTNGAILVSGGGGSAAMSWVADVATGSVLVSAGASPDFSN